MNGLNFLIVDDEEEIREVISFYLQSYLPGQLYLASNGEEAIKILSEKTIDIIFCDYNMPVKNGGDVYRFMLERNLTTHYVLCSSDAPHTFSAFEDFRLLYGFIQKPNLIKGLKEIVQRYKGINQERQAPLSNEYNPIGIKLLRSLKVLPSDVFIKLSDGKFVKAHNAGSDFDDADYLKYEQKGVTHLLAVDIDINHFINKIDQLMIALSSKIDPSQKIEIAIETHSLILNTLHEYGVHDSVIPSIELQIKETLDLCSSDKTLAILLEQLLKSKSSYISRHSFLLSAVCISLANKLEWNSSPTSQKLVISSLFHDAFLNESIVNEVGVLESQCYDDEFRSHSQKAAELLDKIPRIPPDTGRIILEQHEIGEDKGVPRGMSIYETSPLGQLFTFSHFFTDYVFEASLDGPVNKEQVLKKMEVISKKSSKYKKMLSLLKEIDLF
jgi:response regulator RpfG family c-di-GMP phosphodiesterase